MDKDITINTPLVSINIITKNRSKLLQKTLKSVLKQDYTNWEIILIDDGSTDDTEAMVKSLYPDPKIKYSKNLISLGISKARNQALALSKGEYIAVLDSDDEWGREDKLGKQVLFLNENKEHILVGTCAHKIDINGMVTGEIINQETDESIRASFLKRNQFCHSSILMRHIPEIAYNEALGIWEDYDLFLRLGLKGKLANIPEKLTRYRVHGNNVSRSAGVKGALLHIKLMSVYKESYPNYFQALVYGYIRIIKVIFKI